MTDTHNIPCEKQMTIYHIPTKKVGSSGNLKQRMSNQGHTLDDCEILHEIEPNTMSYRAVWELECSEQARLGYKVELENNWKQFLRSHTSNATRDPAVRAKISASSLKRMACPKARANLSDKAKKQWAGQSGENNPMSCPKVRAKISAAKTGSNNPNFGSKAHNAKTYNILTLDGDLFAYTDDPSGFTKEHGLAKQGLNNCASPKCSQRHITLNGIKYTVEYAD